MGRNLRMVFHPLMHVYKLSCMAGHVGLVGLDSFDATEERTTEAYSVQFLPRTA